MISSDHKNDIQFFINHLPCPWILKIPEVEQITAVSPGLGKLF